MSALISRATPLLDVETKGRMVTAYAAPFGVEYEVHDHIGDYTEENDHRSFDHTVKARGTRFGVYYNHGNALNGGPLEAMGQVPLATPKEVKPERRGLLTRALYLSNPFADAVLEAIDKGAITAYSHTSAMIRPLLNGRPWRGTRVPRVQRGQPLPKVRQLEYALKEFGPAAPPLQVADAASIVGVRSGILAGATVNDRATLLYELLMGNLATTPAGGPESQRATPITGAGAAAVEPADGHSAVPVEVRLLARRMDRMGVRTWTPPTGQPAGR